MLSRNSRNINASKITRYIRYIGPTELKLAVKDALFAGSPSFIEETTIELESSDG